MKICNDFEQRSDEWYAMRNGKITMSNAKELLTGGKGATRLSYLREVAAAIIVGPSMDRFQSADMVRGTELEPYALAAYESLVGAAVDQVGFVLADDERIGCSPDGLVGSARAIEIKCPLPKNHIRYLDKAQAAKDHGAQMQGEAWVCETDHVAFVSFCPWVKDAPLIVHTFDRDESTIKQLAESAIRGADEVEEMVRTLRSVAPVDKKVQGIATDAAIYWESYTAMESEVDLSD